MVHKADFARVIWNLADWWVHWTVIKRLQQSQNVDAKSERVKLKIWELKSSVSELVLWDISFELTDENIELMVEELVDERWVERFERNVDAYADNFWDALWLDVVSQMDAVISRVWDMSHVEWWSFMGSALSSEREDPIWNILRRHWIEDPHQFLQDANPWIDTTPRIDWYPLSPKK